MLTIERIPVYIAHPLGGGPDREINRLNAAKWVAWLADRYPIAPVATWITLAGEWPETPENRRRGLEIDKALVGVCRQTWLCGGRVSPGMAIERDKAAKAGRGVLDLTALGFEVPRTLELVIACDHMVAKFWEVPTCQAEDMGGWSACDRPALLQTKDEPRRFYCEQHRTNRHVWREDELEPHVPAMFVGGV